MAPISRRVAATHFGWFPQSSLAGKQATQTDARSGTEGELGVPGERGTGSSDCSNPANRPRVLPNSIVHREQ